MKHYYSGHTALWSTIPIDPKTQRRRSASLDNFGDDMFVESQRNLVALGSRYEAELDDIEAFLAE